MKNGEIICCSKTIETSKLCYLGCYCKLLFSVLQLKHWFFNTVSIVPSIICIHFKQMKECNYWETKWDWDQRAETDDKNNDEKNATNPIWLLYKIKSLQSRRVYSKTIYFFFFLKFRKSLIRLQLFNKALQWLLENQTHFKA
jgi:hypothetical protein